MGSITITNPPICQAAGVPIRVSHYHNGRRLGWLDRRITRGTRKGAMVWPLIGRHRSYHVPIDKIIDMEAVTHA